MLRFQIKSQKTNVGTIPYIENEVECIGGPLVDEYIAGSE